MAVLKSGYRYWLTNSSCNLLNEYLWTPCPCRSGTEVSSRTFWPGSGMAALDRCSPRYWAATSLHGYVNKYIILRSEKQTQIAATALSPKQGCGSGLIQYGFGSSIFAQSGSGSKLKQNFRSQFYFSNFFGIKIWVKSNQKYRCYSSNFFQKVVSAVTFLLVEFF
jgi:hypothetical protein